jgi:WD40 repeat protein
MTMKGQSRRMLWRGGPEFAGGGAISLALVALTLQLPAASAQGAGKPALNRDQHRSKYVLSVAFSADGRWLASVTKGSPYYVWDLATGAATVQRDRSGWQAAPGALALSPQGQLLAAGVVPPFRSFLQPHTSIVRVWSLPSHSMLWQFSQKTQPLSDTAPSTLSFSPDGRNLAGGLFYAVPAFALQHLKLWDARSGRLLFGWARVVDGVASSRFSPHGEIAARPVRLFGGGKPALWEVGARKPVQRYKGCKGVDLLAFSPGGTHLAGGGIEKVCVWSVRSGKMLRSVPGPRGHLVALAFPSRRLVKLAIAQKGIYEWEANGRTTTAGCTLPGLVAPARFSANGNLLAWGDAQRRIVHLWDVQSCKEIRSFQMKPNLSHRGRTKHR